MQTLFENFHFLRGYWLLALIPALLLLHFVYKGKALSNSDQWSKHIDAHLLRHLTVNRPQSEARQPSASKIGFKSAMAVIALVIIALVIIALAGPTWQKSPQSAYKVQQPIVAVLSLAQSMNAQDISPTRLKRAVHKVQDILAKEPGAEKALVIYSDIPFIAAPLTNDAAVIKQMLPELSTGLMPVLGDRLDLAINEATALLARTQQSGKQIAKGRIILLTDSAGELPQASVAAAAKAKRSGYSVSVIGVGTQQGGLLQTGKGQLITDNKGAEQYSKLALVNLKDIANKGGGKFSLLSADDSDLNQLLAVEGHSLSRLVASANPQDSGFKADDWVDMGYWLLIIPVLLSALLFRKGLVFGLMIMLGSWSMQPQNLQAAQAVKPADEATADTQGKIGAGSALLGNSNWQDLWQNQDQQGAQAFENQDYQRAAEQFESQPWQATAHYRKGDFDRAAQIYAGQNPDIAGYNLANAQAKSGDFEAALESYDKYLKLHPEHENARFNRNIVAKLIEDQKKQQQAQKNEQAGQQQQSDKQQQSGGQSAEQNNVGGSQQDKQSQGAENNESGSNQPSQKNGNQGEEKRQSSEKDQSPEKDQNLGKGESSDKEKSSERQKSSGENQGQEKQGDGGEQSAAGSQGSNSLSQAGKQPQGSDVSQKTDVDKGNVASGNVDLGNVDRSKAEPPNADQSSREPSQQDAKGTAKSTDISQPDQSKAERTGEEQLTSEGPEVGKEQAGLLEKLVTKALRGNSDSQGSASQKSTSQEAQEQQAKAKLPAQVMQSIEQQLRRVPDDATGLLRARIHQHYLQLRAGN